MYRSDVCDLQLSSAVEAEIVSWDHGRPHDEHYA